MADEMVQEILNMFNSNKPFVISMPSSNEVQITSEPIFHCDRRYKMESEKDYTKRYKEEDEKEYLKLTKNMIFNRKNYTDNMSDITEATEEIFENMESTQIYKTYNFAYRPKNNLPIQCMRTKITSMIMGNAVVIIRGSTGCGKTTQVPQFILDAEYKKNRRCNIIVTQPRRIAALSIAKRVSQERDWPVGTLVGYQVGLVKNVSQDTRITYCTTGVLLHKLINSKHMLDYTHIILDEVHERDSEQDLLLLVVRKLLRTNSMMVKVILMSATIDVDKFAVYFSTPVEDKLLPAPIIDIPKIQTYNISIYYLDEMDSVGKIPEVSKYEPSITESMIKFCVCIIRIFDHIDKKSQGKQPVEGDISERPAVLVFLPGIHEIEELRLALLLENHTNIKWDILILHSLISTEDQEKIFKKSPPGCRRIILSTSIAESSITVPNVKYVIDFCLTKLYVTEGDSNYHTLQLTWASKASCQQRAGRAGRIMDGRVFRMVPKSFYNTVLCDEIVPELLRTPLANTVLKIKMLDMGEPKALLALAIDPPDLSKLRHTILFLKEVGALINKHDSTQIYDGDLTPLGRVMGALPLEVCVTKLIILGYIFDILQDTIIIAATMSVKNMFSISKDDIEAVCYKKLHWAAESESDSIAYLNVFKVWQKQKATRCIINAREEKEWAQKNGLRVKTLREIDALVVDIKNKLDVFGIKEYVDSTKDTWKAHKIDRTFMIKIVIAGAFYPNYFVRLQCEEKHRQEHVTEGLSYDLNNTVFLHGWPLSQPGIIYTKQFQNIFARHMKIRDFENIKVSFDGSRCVYVTYKSDCVEKNFFVRNAVKMRKHKVPIIIDLLNNTEASRRAKELELTYTHSLNDESLDRQRDEKLYPDLSLNSKDYTKVLLHGPYSPMEDHVIHMVSSGTAKPVQINMTSVNSILLNSCPDKSRKPFLVTQTIHQNPQTSMLWLRDTTLLPDMPGLASLIILIFSPYIELRRDALGTYYTGALCGLGYDHITGNSIFPENDLNIIFDVEITMDDLQTINKLRHWMNVAMHFTTDEENDQKKLIIHNQNQIKAAFNEVIYKKRKKQEPSVTGKFYKWKYYDESLFLVSSRETLRNGVYSLHKALELNEKDEEFEDMFKHLLELEALAYENPCGMTGKFILCKLCQITVHGIIELRIHLCSREHKTKLRMIDVTDKSKDLQALLKTMTL